MFKKIISIITIENSKELKLVSYSIDFEKSLIETLKKQFYQKLEQLDDSIIIVKIFTVMEKN